MFHNYNMRPLGNGDRPEKWAIKCSSSKLHKIYYFLCNKIKGCPIFDPWTFSLSVSFTYLGLKL